MKDFDAKTFRKKLQKSLDAASLVVQEWRPADPSQIRHRYEDKFWIVEDLTNVAMDATRKTMELFFLPSFSSEEKFPLSLLGERREEGREKLDFPVCLRYSATRKCQFIREEERKYTLDGEEIEKGEKLPSEYQRKKVFMWSVEVEQEISLFLTRPPSSSSSSSFFDKDGKERENVLFSQKDVSSVVVETESDRTPFVKMFSLEPIDLDLSFLFRFFVLNQLRERGGKEKEKEKKEEKEKEKEEEREERERIGRIGSFQILEEEGKKITPIRNSSVEESMVAFHKLLQWCQSVKKEIESYQKLRSTWARKWKKKHLRHESVFVPVFPFFDSNIDELQIIESGWQLLLKQHAQSLNEISQQIENEWEKDDDDSDEEEEEKKKKKKRMKRGEGSKSIFNTWCAIMVFRLEHLIELCKSYHSSLEYVEWMLYSQIVAAIGKKISASDFAMFMKWYTPRFFLSQFHPSGFSLPVRSASSSPAIPTLSSEGMIRIEERMTGPSSHSLSSTRWEAIDTIGGRRKLEEGIRVSLSAASEMKCLGYLSVHSHIRHQFGRAKKEPTQSMRLSVRAKQFSSFILLIGRIGQGGRFDVEYGLLARNKDQFSIPFKIEVIPSIKEFKAAIVSLSPQQQEFSQMFRGMQLGNTLWGMCVIQVRPQIEKVLGLLPGSLLKEIELTQDILDLLLEYNFPIDLLSVSPTTKKLDEEEGERDRRIEEVRTNVQKMKEMIEQEKKELLKKDVEHQKALWGPLEQVSHPIAEYNWSKIDGKSTAVEEEGSQEIMTPQPKQKKFLGFFSPRGSKETIQRPPKKRTYATVVITGLQGSGKSTLMKQLQLIFSETSDEAKEEYFRILKKNLFCALLDLCFIAGKRGFIAEVSPDLNPQMFMATLQSMRFNDPSFLKIFQALWQRVKDLPSPEIDQIWQWRYFLDDLPRICSLSPSGLTESDILHLKATTNKERELEFNNIRYIYVPRLKEISSHVMESSAVLFVVPVDEFHVINEEKQNRLAESFMVLQDLSALLERMGSLPLVVFLKSDDLSEKLKSYSFANYFPEYTGSNERSDVLKYVKSKISSWTPQRLYIHIVSVRVTKNVQVVFESVRDLMLSRTLSECGFAGGGGGGGGGGTLGGGGGGGLPPPPKLFKNIENESKSPRSARSEEMSRPMSRRGKKGEGGERLERGRGGRGGRGGSGGRGRGRGGEGEEVTRGDRNSEIKGEVKKEGREVKKREERGEEGRKKDEKKKEDEKKEEKREEKKEEKREEKKEEKEQEQGSQNEEKKELSIINQKTPSVEALFFSEKSVTELPSLLEKLFEKYGVDGIVRPNILHLGATWERIQQKSLLSRPESSSLSQKQQERERRKCIDLLDAITRSGGVGVDDVEVHVLLSWTHSAEMSVMETIVQQNVNPIERMESILVALGSGLFGLSSDQFVVSEKSYLSNAD